MTKSIIRTMLTSTTGFAWSLITTGKHIDAFAERLGADEAYDLRAPFSERMINKLGMSITALGERLEWATNLVAMRLGYRDGEVSGLVAEQL